MDNIVCDNAKPDKKRPNITKQLLRMVDERQPELFRSTDDLPYIVLTDKGQKQTFRIDEKPFEHWLIDAYCQENDRRNVPTNNACQRAIIRLEAKAMNCGNVRPVFTRIGHYQGAMYLDLCQENNHCIRIDKTGWKVIDNPPLVFHRPPTAAALPMPQEGGSIEALANHINVVSDDFLLVACWLIDALKGQGPYHMLVMNGPQGSAKSWTTHILSSLIDPHKAAGLNSIGKKVERDIGIDAYNQFILPYDNVSFLNQQQSDCLCRLATGAGVRIRKLRTDAAQVCFGFARPVILNGIPDFASAPDLIDRCIIVECPSIAESDRQTEEELRMSFNNAHPELLGAVCDLLSKALTQEGPTGSLPRMADSYSMMYRASKAAPWGVSDFQDAYASKRANALALGVESCPISEHVVKFLSSYDDRMFLGTSGELWDSFKAFLEDSNIKIGMNDPYPRSARGLTDMLKRYAPALTTLGISFKPSSRQGKNRKRLTCLRLVEGSNDCPTSPITPSYPAPASMWGTVSPSTMANIREMEHRLNA